LSDDIHEVVNPAATCTPRCTRSIRRSRSVSTSKSPRASAALTRRAGMAGIGLLHRVHREGANGVYAKLIGGPAQYEPLAGASMGATVIDLGLAGI
jgi:hypothetical protein